VTYEFVGMGWSWRCSSVDGNVIGYRYCGIRTGILKKSIKNNSGCFEIS